MLKKLLVAFILFVFPLAAALADEEKEPISVQAFRIGVLDSVKKSGGDPALCKVEVEDGDEARGYLVSFRCSDKPYKCAAVVQGFRSQIIGCIPNPEYKEDLDKPKTKI